MRKIKWWHIHRYDTPVASRYRSFNWRDVIYECRCGDRKFVESVWAENILPYMETCDTIQQEKFKEYLTNGKYHENSESHRKLWASQ